MTAAERKFIMSDMDYVVIALESKHSTTSLKTSTDTCCLCETKVTGAILLCPKHWDEYSEAAKGDFKQFQEYRKKIADGLLRQLDI